jgi:hypothetical protein
MPGTLGPVSGSDPDAERPAVEIDQSKPHSARMYDYYLGGKNHYAVDRETAERAIRSWRGIRTAAVENRAFMARAVRYLVADAGIRQFLDIGTGLPTTDNVHEVAQRIAPDSRIVYADNDPIVLAHARALLTSDPRGATAYIQADLREPETILNHPATRSTLDFSKPIALMLVAILHFLVDEDRPAEIVRTLVDALPAGSFLVASHITAEHDPEGVHGLEQTYRQSGVQGQARNAADFQRIAFTGLELAEPGVVLVSEWRPERPHRPTAAEVNGYGGVAKKAR